MQGLLNINKPAGVTSRRVVDVVAKVAGTKQVGHAGTLDPLATGVLVVCMGWTTRLVPLIQQQHKEYRAEFLLGQTSDTDDITGQITAQFVTAPPSRETILEQLPRFVGRITQTPPSFSAVLVGGRRAYKLARRGKAVAVPPREVDVYRMELLRYEFPRLEVVIECGSGTYIRSIARDLGQLLGCGAVMSGLVRTRIGGFQLQSAVPLSDVTPTSIAERLCPASMATAHLTQRICTSEDLDHLRCGRSIACVPGESLPLETEIALLSPTSELAALAIFNPTERRLQPRQVYCVPRLPNS